MSANFDLHVDGRSTFRHEVIALDDGTEFLVFRIETPETTVNLFFGSSDVVSFDDEQTALRLSVAAAESWCDMDRLYRRQVRTPAQAEDAIRQDPTLRTVEAVA